MDKGQILNKVQANLTKLFLDIYYVDFSKDKCQTIDTNHTNDTKRFTDKETGRYTEILEEYLEQSVLNEYRAKVREMGSAAYAREHLSEQEPFYSFTYKRRLGDSYRWYRMYVIWSCADENNRAKGATIAFRDVHEEECRQIQYHQKIKEQSRELQLMHFYENALKSTVLNYEKVYYVALDQDYYHMIYPRIDCTEEKGSYTDAVSRQFEKNKIAIEDKERAAAFLSIKNIKEQLMVQDYMECRYRRVNVDGQWEWCLTTFTVGEREDGEVKTAIMAIRSIDNMVRQDEEHKKELREALQEAQSVNDEKALFLANMSHELRTPMNAIIGYTSIAASNIDSKRRVQECLNKIMASSNYLLDFVNNVLDISKLQDGRVELKERPCNLSELLHGVIDIVRPQILAKHLNIYIDTLDVQTEDIYADTALLNQVFINLISNAIKFTDMGGTIFLCVKQYSCKEENKAAYEFILKDTGVGIGEAFRDHIFEAFEKENNSSDNNTEGAGLGLYVTKNIIDMMNGTVNAESRQGEGTEFKIRFNFRIQEESMTHFDCKSLKDLRVLVVDDDFDSCDQMTKMLKRIGMDPSWTLSAREAVLRAKKAKEESESYYAYIIDWYMPDMSGIDLTRKLRDIVGNDVPIYIMTAYDWGDVEDLARSAGVTGLYKKPLFLSDLRMIFNQNLIQTEEPETEVPSEEEWPLKGKRMLLVEDNEWNMEVAREFLKQAGVSVEETIDGAEAVERVSEMEPYYYDAVLMDIQMPVMDGYEATRRIRKMDREDTRSLPIIAMTANAFIEDKRQAFESGMNAHLAKPIDRERLYNTLEEILKDN